MGAGSDPGSNRGSSGPGAAEWMAGRERGGEQSGVVRRAFLGRGAALFAAGVSALAAACGSGQTAGPTSPQQLAPATLTFLSRGDPNQRQLDLEATSMFTAESPNVKVDVVTAKDYENELISQAAGGDSPDIGFGLISTSVAHYLKKINRSLTPFIAKDKTFKQSDYDPYWLEAYNWRGQLVGMPFDSAMIVAYYNKTLFDKASKKYPDENTPMTWEDLITLAKTLTVDSNGHTAAESGFSRDDLAQAGLEWTIFGHEWVPMIWQNGQEPFDKDYTQLNQDATIAALQFLGDLYQKHAVSVPPAAKPPQPIGFDKGNVAIKVFGSWDVKSWRKTPGDVWDVAPMPHLQSKARVGLGWGSGLELLNGKAPPDTAWALFKFLIGPKGQETYLKGGLGQPLLKSMANSPTFAKSNPPYRTNVLIGETKYAKEPPFSYPGWNDMEPPIKQMLTAVYNGQKSAADGVHEIAASVNAVCQDWVKRIQDLSK